MKCKINPSKTAVAEPGIYPTHVLNVQQDEKKQEFTAEFQLPNKATVKKTFPVEMEQNDADYREVGRIAGKDVFFAGDLDPENLKGSKQVIVVGTKRTTGGRVTPTVALIIGEDEFRTAAEAVLKQLDQPPAEKKAP